MLSSAVAGAPAAAAVVVTAIATAEAAVAAVAALLVAASALVAQSSEAILAVLAALQMGGVSAVALLLRRQALASSAGSALGSGSGATLLGTERRGAGSALGVAKGLQSIVSSNLLAHLLLTERGTLASIALSTAESIRETSETARSSAMLVLRGAGDRPAVLAKSSAESVIATMLSEPADVSRGRAVLIIRGLGVDSVVRL